MRLGARSIVVPAALLVFGCTSNHTRHYRAEQLSSLTPLETGVVSGEAPLEIGIQRITDRAAIEKVLGPRASWLLRAGYVFRISMKSARPASGPIELGVPFATLEFSESEDYVPLDTAQIVRLSSISEAWDPLREPAFVRYPKDDPLHPERQNNISYPVANEGDAVIYGIAALTGKALEASEQRDARRYADESGPDILEKTRPPRRLDGTTREWIAVFAGKRSPNPMEPRTPVLRMRLVVEGRPTRLSVPVVL